MGDQSLFGRVPRIRMPAQQSVAVGRGAHSLSSVAHCILAAVLSLEVGLLAVVSGLELLLGALDRPLDPKVLLSNPVVTVHAAESQPILDMACCLKHSLEYTQVTAVVHKALAERTLLAK